MTIKNFLFVLTFIFVASLSFAQDVESLKKWEQEFAERARNRTEANRKNKPNAAKDVLFTKPDFVVFVPELDPDIVGDAYNDHFLVFDKHGDKPGDKPDVKLFAVWTQGSYEGTLDQHFVFSRSYDKGKTWEKPRILAGNPTIAAGFANKGNIASWAFPMVSKSGRIYIVYNQHVPGKVSSCRPHTALMTGIYSDDDGDNWSKPQTITIPRTFMDSPDPTVPSEWIVWQKPLRLGKDDKYLVGVSRHANPELQKQFSSATEFIRFENIDENPEPKDIVTKWFMQGEKALRSGRYCEEPSIVKLPDGRLFCVMRTGTGSPVWSVSGDLGETWTTAKPLLFKDGGEPIPHPMSPCPIYDAKGNTAASGLCFLFVHNKYDKADPNPWQNRGPLFLLAGRFQKDADQPVWFDEPKEFVSRKNGQAFYSSVTQLDGKTVLWYPDLKFYLVGRYIGDEWF